MLVMSDYRNELHYRMLMVHLCQRHGVTEAGSFGIGAYFVVKFSSINPFPREGHAAFFRHFSAALKLVALPFAFCVGLVVCLVSALLLTRQVTWFASSFSLTPFDSLFFSHDNTGEAKIRESKYMTKSLCIVQDSYSKQVQTQAPSIFNCINRASRPYYFFGQLPVYIVRDLLSCLLLIIMNPQVRLIDLVYIVDLAARIPHKCVYELAFEYTLKRKRFAYVLTSNKEDRFAMLEARLCRLLNTPLLCIPHGIEYQVKFPDGLAGDQFFCTTQYTAKMLAEIYDEPDKFIYDHALQKSLYSKNLVTSSDRRLVFFTEPRLPEINFEICQVLLKSNIKFGVRLHPSESITAYKKAFPELHFEEHFDSAISGNVCIGRTTSVLVEALFNSSLPVCVMVNDYDREVVSSLLPSLSSPKILKVESLSGLVELIGSLGLGGADG